MTNDRDRYPYRVLLPYTETPNLKKRFTVEYTVEATDRVTALAEAEKEFYAYTRYNSASWVRILQSEGIRIWRLMPDLPQTPESIDALVAYLENPDVDVLYNALRVLGELEDQTATAAVARLIGHGNVEIAALAIDTLGKLGDAHYVDAILGCFVDGANPRIKACVLSALARLGKPEQAQIQDVLSRALGDEDTRVRANAVELVERLQLPDAPRVLVPLMHDEDNRVRANVLKALWRSHDRETLVKSLEAMVSDRNHWMRASAAFVLRYLDVANRTALVGKLLRDTDPEVRASSLKTLLALEDVGEVVPLLLEYRVAHATEVGDLLFTRFVAFGAAGWLRLMTLKTTDPAVETERCEWLQRFEAIVRQRDGNMAWLRLYLRRWWGN